jgi:hypothetical protein
MIRGCGRRGGWRICGQLNGQTVFSHGIKFGIAQAGTRDLRETTMTWRRRSRRTTRSSGLPGNSRP